MGKGGFTAVSAHFTSCTWRIFMLNVRFVENHLQNTGIMLPFCFSVKEYESLRYSYDWKQVFFLTQDRLYHRNLALGRIEKDELSSIYLYPVEMAKLKGFMLNRFALEDISQHLPAESEGLHARYKVQLSEANQLYRHLYTGPDSALDMAFPELAQLRKKLTQQEASHPESTESVPPSSYDSLRIFFHHETRFRTQNQLQEFKLEGKLMTVKNLVSGEKRVVQISPFQQESLYRFLQREYLHLEKTASIQKGRSSLLDSVHHVHLDLEIDGKRLTQDLSGYHFNLIDHLSFLVLELLEKRLRSLSRTRSEFTVDTQPHQACSRQESEEYK